MPRPASATTRASSPPLASGRARCRRQHLLLGVDGSPPWARSSTASATATRSSLSPSPRSRRLALPLPDPARGERGRVHQPHRHGRQDHPDPGLHRGFLFSSTRSVFSENLFCTGTATSEPQRSGPQHDAHHDVRVHRHRGASVYSRSPRGARMSAGRPCWASSASLHLRGGHALQLLGHAATGDSRHAAAFDGRPASSPWSATGARSFISVGVIVSVLGAYLAWTLMAAEVMYIPARADDMPRFLGQENAHGTPITALVVTTLGPGAARPHAVRQTTRSTSCSTCRRAWRCCPYFLAAGYALRSASPGRPTRTSHEDARRETDLRRRGDRVHAVPLRRRRCEVPAALDRAARAGSPPLRQGPERARHVASSPRRRSALLAVILSGGGRRRGRPLGPDGSPSELHAAFDRKAIGMTESMSSTYGVHSEVGRLRKVLVCAPGLAHRRLTPEQQRRRCCSTTSCGWRTPSATTPTSSTS